MSEAVVAQMMATIDYSKYKTRVTDHKTTDGEFVVKDSELRLSHGAG